MLERILFNVVSVLWLLFALLILPAHVAVSWLDDRVRGSAAALMRWDRDWHRRHR